MPLQYMKQCTAAAFDKVKLVNIPQYGGATNSGRRMTAV